MNWSDVLNSALPTVAILGAGLLRSHLKIRKALEEVQVILAALTSGKSGQ